MGACHFKGRKSKPSPPLLPMLCRQTCCVHTPTQPLRQACRHVGGCTHTHVHPPTHTHVHTQVLGPQVPPNASWGVELSLISLLITRHHCALSLALTHLPSAQGPQARAGLPLHDPCLCPSQQVTSRTQIPLVAPWPRNDPRGRHVAAIGDSQGREEGDQSQNGQWGRCPRPRATSAELGLTRPQLLILPLLLGRGGPGPKESPQPQSGR